MSDEKTKEDSSKNSLMRKTHYCGRVSKNDIGKEVVLLGWVKQKSERDESTVIEVGDHTGFTQVILPSEIVENLRLESEFVVAVKGVLREKTIGKTSTNRLSGTVELVAREIQERN